MDLRKLVADEAGVAESIDDLVQMVKSGDALTAEQTLVARLWAVIGTTTLTSEGE